MKKNVVVLGVAVVLVLSVVIAELLAETIALDGAPVIAGGRPESVRISAFPRSLVSADSGNMTTLDGATPGLPVVGSVLQKNVSQARLPLASLSNATLPKSSMGIEVANPWVNMPAGARIAYIGIHGGTVPVSLLTSGDGSPMIAQVGLTGSDFLHFLRTGGKPADAALLTEAEGGEAVVGETFGPPLFISPPPLPGKNATMLLAGTAVGDVPVIYATGRTFEDMSLIPANWAPFGLTEKALAVEGAVKVVMPPKKKARRGTRPRG